MLQKSYVVFGEHAQVFHAIFQVGDALHAHAECVTSVLFRIDAASLKHVGVDHAAAENFDPTRVFAEVATFAAAQVARNVHLGAWFGEWEVRWTQANLRLFAKHLFGKIEQCLFQVGERNIFVDVETLYLMEKAVRAVRNGLVAIDATGAKHANWRFLTGHHARLNARSVRTQQHVGWFLNADCFLYKEGILHVARWVLWGKIQHAVHMFIVLNFRTFGHGEADAREYVDNLFADERQRVACAKCNGFGRARKIGLFGFCALFGKRLSQLVQLVLSAVAQLVQKLPDFAFFVVRNIAKFVEKCRNLPFFAEVLNAQSLQFFLRFDR